MLDSPSPHSAAPAPAQLAELRRRTALWLFRAAALLALVLVWLGVTGAPGDGPRDLGALPVFSLPTLDGSTVDGAVLEGQVTVVNFWASWCPPCRSEAPILAAVAADTADEGVQFLGVLHRERREPALEFAEQYGLHFPTVVDDGAFARSLGVRSIPMTFVVGVDGSILARHFGPISEGRLRVLIADAQSVAATGPTEVP